MKSRNHILFLILLTGSSQISCLKEPNLDPTYPSQLFRPINFSGNVDAADVSFSWAPIRNASYLLEISRDSFRFERDLKSIPLDGQIRFEIGDLWSQSRYSARIKAISKKPGVRDSEYSEISFTTGLENVFFQIDSASITPTGIDLSWEPGKTVTHIEVSGTGNPIRRIALTEGEINTGSLLVENLEPGTLYTFRIYNGEILRGTIATQTSPQEN